MGDVPETAAAPGSIRRSSARAGSGKKKKDLIPVGILTGVILTAAGIFLGVIDQKLAIFWFTGIAFGFILQRSRFCFTASMRDPSLTGSTSVTRAVLIAFAITSIGFWVSQGAADTRTVLHRSGQFRDRGRRNSLRHRHGNRRRLRLGNPDAGRRRLRHADALPVVFHRRIPLGRP